MNKAHCYWLSVTSHAYTSVSLSEIKGKTLRLSILLSDIEISPAKAFTHSRFCRSIGSLLTIAIVLNYRSFWSAIFLKEINLPFWFLTCHLTFMKEWNWDCHLSWVKSGSLTFAKNYLKTSVLNGLNLPHNCPFENPL